MTKNKKSKKEKVLVIVGPTASGKTSLSLRLAKEHNGEIISADSRQVYRGLDIGTEKIKEEEMNGIRHHLIDVCEPENVFSVQEFKDQASTAVSEILSREHLPIVVGGTGFYVDALLYNISFPEVAPNESLRRELEGKSAEELFKQIEEKDPERANAIDPNNKRRLVRALEVIEVLGKVPALENREERYDSLIVGIKTEDEVLKKQIRKRLDEALMDGLMKETLYLLHSGLTPERVSEFGLEYRIVLKVIEGNLEGKKMKERMLTELWHYAKRQKTWFKKNKQIKWFGLDAEDDIEKEVTNFIN